MSNYNTIGFDLVAMCVNDIVVQGAEPLFFLDYFATEKLNIIMAKNIIQGIVDGCLEANANCALIGGETAELPGLYSDDNFDLAGFAVGAVERGQLITGENIKAGDVVLGLASSGLHSNGFSLVREIIKDKGLLYTDHTPYIPHTIRTTVFGHQIFGQDLLTPTKIYVKSCLALAKAGLAKGFAHITGGGLLRNIPRILPNDKKITLDATQWHIPPVFKWLAKNGNVSTNDMALTFNLGIGMIAIVDKNKVNTAINILSKLEKVYIIGEVVNDYTNHCEIINLSKSIS